MAFKSEVLQRHDGRAMFVATEDNMAYRFVHRERYVAFTDAELLDLKLAAMKEFDFLAGLHAPDRLQRPESGLASPDGR